MNSEEIFSHSQLFKKIEYKKFSFIHMDVMGSGRFFYVDSIDTVKVDLE